jgi:regulator of protease activity HflC (stomatin/prohibitin superfamily)
MSAYEDYELRLVRQEKERQERELQKQLKNKKTMKSIILGVVGFILLITLFFSCERIDAGHVGVKVNLYGTGKGVDDVTECTGMVFYNPFTTKIYEFPTYIQHKEYKDENSFSVNSKDGSEFHVSPIVNYSVSRDRVPFIFGKYRRELGDIEEGFLKTAIYEAFRIVTNSYNADLLISSRQEFDSKVRKALEDQLQPEGFILSQFTSNLVYPETFKKAIESKNNAVQSALMAENQVKTAEAQAKIKIATAEGNAQAMLTAAKAEAEANSLKQKTITPMLLQLEWINKWNGKLPETMLGDKTNAMIGIK